MWSGERALRAGEGGEEVGAKDGASHGRGGTLGESGCGERDKMAVTGREWCAEAQGSTSHARIREGRWRRVGGGGGEEKRRT